MCARYLDIKSKVPRLGRKVVKEIGASESIPPRPERQKGRAFRGRARRLPIVPAAVAAGDGGCCYCCTALVSFPLHVSRYPRPCATSTRHE